MAESAHSLFRRGAISPRQASRLGVVKGTKHQTSKMADFDEKSKDEGNNKTRGIADTDSSSINKNQRAGSVIGGKPTKGGFVQSKGQPDADAIDQNQTPKFPKGDTVKASHGKLSTKLKARIRPSGGEYGGPNGRP
jgi:hypothetical protein